MPVNLAARAAQADSALATGALGRVALPGVVEPGGMAAGATSRAGASGGVELAAGALAWLIAQSPPSVTAVTATTIPSRPNTAARPCLTVGTLLTNVAGADGRCGTTRCWRR